MNCSTPGLPVHHQLPEFTQTPVHRVGDAIQPSYPLSPPSPALNLFQHQVFPTELTLHIRWPKYWSFSFSISPSNKYSVFILGLTGLISLQPRDSQVFSSTTIQKHQFLVAQPSIWSSSHPYMTTGKTTTLTRWTFVGKVMSLHSIV